jgi:hypothetical protein
VRAIFQNDPALAARSVAAARGVNRDAGALHDLKERFSFTGIFRFVFIRKDYSIHRILFAGRAFDFLLGFFS